MYIVYILHIYSRRSTVKTNHDGETATPKVPTSAFPATLSVLPRLLGSSYLQELPHVLQIHLAAANLATN